MEALAKSVRKILVALAIGFVAAGCASERHLYDSRADSQILTGSWRVEKMDQEGVIDHSMVTLQFVEEGRIAGSTGCNRYTGMLRTGNGAFVVSQAVTTRMACASEVMNQERRFLAALNEAAHYEIEADTWLLLYDAADKLRLKLIQVDKRSGPQNMIVDKAPSTKSTFHCENVGTVVTRFLGPETIEVSVGEHVAILNREQTASAAKYSGDDMSFWNKGSVALLRLNGVDNSCTRKSP